MTNSPTPLAPADGRRLAIAFGRMPYAGMLPGARRTPETVDDVLAFLDGLRDELLRAAATAEANERDLDAIRRDLAAVRRVFGVDA